MATDPEFAAKIIFGGLGLFVLSAIVVRILDTLRNGVEKQVYTNIAVTNGFLLQLGFSPLGEISAALTEVAPVLNSEFSQLAQTLLLIGTILDLLFGAGKLYERSEWIGIVAFIIGMFGGALLLIVPSLGVLTILFGNVIISFAPTKGF